MHEGQLDLVALELAEALGEGLERAGDVGLQHEVERGRFAGLDLLEDVLEAGATRHAGGLPAQVGHAVPVLALLGDGAGRLLVGGHHEAVAGLGDVVQAEDLHGHGRPGLLDLLAEVVDQRPHATPGRAGHEGLADLEGAALHEDVGDGAAADVEVRLEDDAGGAAVGVGPEVLDVGHKEERLEEVVHAVAGEGRHRDHLDVAAPVLGDQAVLGELLLHAVGLGLLAVDLVDGHHDRGARRLGVVEGLDGLGHHAVVGRHHQHDDVGGLGAAGPHGGERLVARGVDEGDEAAVLDGLVGTDVLRDAAGLAGDHVGVADLVEQLRLAVVDVAHDRDDRGPGHSVLVIVLEQVLDAEHLLEVDLLLLAGVDQPDGAPISSANSSICSSLSDCVAVTISPICMRKRTTSAAVRFSLGPSSCGVDDRSSTTSPSGTGASVGV